MTIDHTYLCFYRFLISRRSFDPVMYYLSFNQAHSSFLFHFQTSARLRLSSLTTILHTRSTSTLRTYPALRAHGCRSCRAWRAPRTASTYSPVKCRTIRVKTLSERWWILSNKIWFLKKAFERLKIILEETLETSHDKGSCDKCYFLFPPLPELTYSYI